MTTPPKDALVTEAGRFLLAWDHNGAPMPPDVFRDSIKRIETEAATAARSDEIDVETLARAMDASMEGRLYRQNEKRAEAIVREYARLRSEQGERTPRVDPEIDAT